MSFGSIYSSIVMKKIFISYGSKSFKDTLKRIKKEAHRLRIFDKVIIYTEKDLPEWICQSPLFNYAMGGYWLWKPYVILKTMQRYPNALIIYADAGCSLNRKHEEWNNWFYLMEKNEMLVQAYQPNIDYGWQEKFKTSSIEISTWTKKNTLDFFDEKFGTSDWHCFNKIWAGMIIVKHDSTLIKEWLDIMLSHPELVLEPTGEELNMQNSEFVMHRYDQSILTALVYWYINENNLKICVIPETAESIKNAAVVASRIRMYEPIPLKSKVIGVIKRVIGEKWYSIFHFWR